MKKAFYIFSFTVLGILLGFLVHAGVEIFFIDIIFVENHDLGISIDNWFLIHKIWTAITLISGALFGFFSGKYWWVEIYIKHRRWKKDV